MVQTHPWSSRDEFATHVYVGYMLRSIKKATYFQITNKFLVSLLPGFHAVYCCLRALGFYNFKIKNYWNLFMAHDTGLQRSRLAET